MTSLIKPPGQAITLWRPWDQAIMHGGKPVENRKWALWPSLIGKPLALHGAVKYDTQGAEWMRGMDLYDPPREPDCPKGIIGVVVFDRIVDEDDCDNDPLNGNPWFFGRYGWVVKEKVALPAPVICRGRQGIWRLGEDLYYRVAAQLECLP